MVKVRSTNLVILASLIANSLATPPACLLACVNKVSKSSHTGLSDLSSLCGNSYDVIKSCLNDICPNNNSGDAIKSLSSSCSNYSSNSSSSSSSSSAASSSAASLNATTSDVASSVAASSNVASSVATSSSALVSGDPSSAASSITLSSVEPSTEPIVSSAAEGQYNGTSPSTEGNSPVSTLSTASIPVESSAVVPSVQTENLGAINGFSLGAALVGLIGVLI